MGGDVRFGRNGRDHLKRGVRFFYDHGLRVSAYRRRDQPQRDDVEQTHRQCAGYRVAYFGSYGIVRSSRRNRDGDPDGEIPRFRVGFHWLRNPARSVRHRKQQRFGIRSETRVRYRGFAHRARRRRRPRRFRIARVRGDRLQWRGRGRERRRGTGFHRYRSRTALGLHDECFMKRRVHFPHAHFFRMKRRHRNDQSGIQTRRERFGQRREPVYRRLLPFRMGRNH